MAEGERRSALHDARNAGVRMSGALSGRLVREIRCLKKLLSSVLAASLCSDPLFAVLETC